MRSPTRLREAHVGHGRKRAVPSSESLQHGQQRLGAERAIDTDDLHIFLGQAGRRIGRARAAQCGALFGKSQLGHNGKRGKRAHRVNGRKQHLDIGESLQYEEIHAALLERLGLLAIDFKHLFAGRLAHFRSDGQRPDRAGDQHLMRGGFAGLAGNLHAAMIDLGDLIGEAERGELGAIGAEGIGLNNLRAGLDIGLMNAKDCLGLGGVQLLKAALRADGLKQHGTHGAIGDEYGRFDSLLEICDFHGLGSPCPRALSMGFGLAGASVRSSLVSGLRGLPEGRRNEANGTRSALYPSPHLFLQEYHSRGVAGRNLQEYHSKGVVVHSYIRVSFHGT